jgi:hypothetical protein
VTQVIISPRNRLVSHIVVAGNVGVNWQPVRGEWLVPIWAVARVNEGGVSLSETLGRLTAWPTFDEAAFPLAPIDWLPPFPYTPGTVRWPGAEIREIVAVSRKPQAALMPAVQAVQVA